MNRKKNNALQLSGSFLFNRYEPPTYQSQYRATQMWNKSLEAFLQGVPLTQHRSKVRFWRVYEESFTGAEAVSWFHSVMREKFDGNIEREQARKLLGKFYRAGVFRNVEVEEDAGLDEKDFKDSQMHIYRLTMERPATSVSAKSSPGGKTSPSGIAKKSPKKDYTVEIKALSRMEKEQIYFGLFVQKLAPLTTVPVCSMLPQHNANVYFNITGERDEKDKDEEVFPEWIVPAMKYLMNYPSESHLHVDYANFEHDVFILVFDFFFTSYERVGRFIQEADLFYSVWHNIQPQLPNSKYEDKFPFPKSEFEEIDKIFTPKSQASRRFIMGKNRKRIFHEPTSVSLSSALRGTPIGSMDDSVNVTPMGLLDPTRYRSSVYFATSFDVKSPVTRVLSQNEMYAYDNPTLNLSPADIINHPKYGRLRGRLNGGRKSLSVGDLIDDTSDDDGGFRESRTCSSKITIPGINVNDDNEYIHFHVKVPNIVVPAPETKQPTVEAISLLLLLIDPVKRKRLEVVLRFMGKLGNNQQLCLDVAVTNSDVVYDYFSRLIIDHTANENQRNLISFMIANVDNLFNSEFLEDLKQKAEEAVSEKQIIKIPISSSTNSKCKENLSLSTSYCSQISMREYEDQRLLGETAKSLRNLLDALCEVKDEKLKKKQLKKFQKEYPHIYSEKFSNSTLENSPFQAQKNNKRRTPFGVLI